MKPSRFLLAACALAPALAAMPALAADAPATPATPPVALTLAPAVVPQIDAAAVALMDEAVGAYAALPQLSQSFTVASFQDGVAYPDESSTGSFVYQKPGNARLQAVVGGEDNIEFVTDGTTLSFQNRPKKYQQEPMKRNPIGNVLSAIPSSADRPLNLLVNGLNPINGKGALKWQSARLDSKDGMPGVVLVGPDRGERPPASFGYYLDPQTKLLARVEASAQVQSQQDGTTILNSEVTTLSTSALAITPDLFRYVPGPGIERLYAYDPSLVVGADPFALVGKTLSDDFISLDSYKGRVVMLDFWATWCPPCRAEMPNLIKNYNNYHPWGFDIVGISGDDPRKEAMLRRFVAANKMAWPQILDNSLGENSNSKKYAVEFLPFTLLIGKDGKIAAVNPRDEDLEPEIRAALMKS